MWQIQIPRERVSRVAVRHLEFPLSFIRAGILISILEILDPIVAVASVVTRIKISGHLPSRYR
jgi:hypothetical protein